MSATAMVKRVGQPPDTVHARGVKSQSIPGRRLMTSDTQNSTLLR